MFTAVPFGCRTRPEIIFAAHVALNMTDKQLADAGIDRRTFPLDAMTRMEAEFAEKDAQKATAHSAKTVGLDIQAA